MRTHLLPLLAACAALVAPTRAAGQEPAAFAWETATPESQGMSEEKPDALKDDLAKRGTKAFLVIRNDRIVYESRRSPSATSGLTDAEEDGLPRE